MPPATTKPANRGRRIWIAALLLATGAYYFWTAMLAPGGPPPIHGNESDHFNHLSRGFLKGQLSLDLEPPAGLLRAANPYDPALRRDVTVLHDASYFRGKYYIYFGPAPVVTLLLPFRVATGRDLPLPYAVWLFSCVGTFALAATFLTVQRRYFPRAGGASVTAGLIALGGATLVVTLLRRSNIWELSAASGFAFFSLSLYFLTRALHSARATRWALAGGLALGLAVASRPPYLLGSLLFVLAWLGRRHRATGPQAYGFRAVVAAALGCLGPVLALIAYNTARFGQPLEFGVTYQLTSVIESESKHFSLSYVPFNAHRYFLAPLEWKAEFPFVSSTQHAALPPGHGGLEYTFGLFTNLPFSLLAFFTLGALIRSRRDEAASGFRRMAALIAVAVLANAAFLLCFFGCCIRYMVDFTPWVMLLAAWGALLAEDRLRGHWSGGPWRAVVLLLALASSALAAAAVVRFYDPGVDGVPAAYRPVARVADAPGHWLRHLRWPDYGPREIELAFPADRTRRLEPLFAVGPDGTTRGTISVEYLDERKLRFAYQERGSARAPVYSSAVNAPGNGKHTLRLDLGGRYADYDGRRARLRAQFDELPLWDVPVVGIGTFPGRITIGSDATARFTGTIHAVRPVALAAATRPRVSGIRARLTLTPEMAGRSFPLVTTGRTKAGDLFFVRVSRTHDLSFGYDHWGDTLLLSPGIPAAAGQSRVIEFWVPALTPEEPDAEILVKVDGQVAWRQRAPAYPVSPSTLFVGSNPIGGSTCEETVQNVIFEDLQLPRK